MGIAMVKSTLNIVKENKEGLENLVKENEISSVTEGVNIAIKQFLLQKRSEQYARQMKEAASDKDFIKRTESVNNEFKYADVELDEIMVAEDAEW